jgi:energy-coupling factor transporter ATP-binding protein EcfA2
MEATIEVAGLRKRFGSAQALNGMSFSVLPGQVTGFVGPNGAGKSTTMRVVLGLDAADEGTALIGGQPYHVLRHPLSRIGALLDASAGWRIPRAWAPGGSMRFSSRRASRRSPSARPAATPWACGSGSASPARCSATRRS